MLFHATFKNISVISWRPERDLNSQR